MYLNDQLYVAHCDNGPLYMTGKMCNRHGLIAGATGTGKTVSLQVLAETFSQAGVPCFMADMKGDLSGISQAGKYDQIVDRESAFEVLLAQSEQESAAQAQAEATAQQEKEAAKHSQAGHFYGRKVSDTRNPGQSAEIERGRYM